MATISERLDVMECSSIKTLFQDMLKIINSHESRIQQLEKQNKVVFSDPKPRNSESKSNTEEVTPEMDDNEIKLYEKIREWRLCKCRKEGFPAFCIFSNKVLVRIVKSKAKNKEDLSAIRGFGKVKLEKYGDDILNLLIQDKCHGRNLKFLTQSCNYESCDEVDVIEVSEYEEYEEEK